MRQDWEPNRMYYFSTQCSMCMCTCRNSRPKVFCKKGVLRNFSKFRGKHLYQSLFLNKVIKKEAQVFSCEFCEISSNTFFTEYLRAAASVYFLLFDTSFPLLGQRFWKETILRSSNKPQDLLALYLDYSVLLLDDNSYSFGYAKAP